MTSGTGDGGGAAGPPDDDSPEGTWDVAGCRVTECKRCPDLVTSRGRIVNGVGPTDASLVFVGEGPGATEDAEGEPFVGRSGGVLDEALRTAGLDRIDVRITNCVRCRPPENRNPRTAELESCRGYLERELVTIDPALVVTLGKVPAEHLLGRDVAVTAEAGDRQEVTIGGEALLVMVSLHPAATLYDPGQRETFASTIAAAADYAADGGQATLDGF